MELPAGYLNKKTTPEPHAPRNEREEMIVKFLERINPPRVHRQIRPLTYSRMAKVLEWMPTKDLYWMFKQCERADSFGAMFWHIVKEHKPKPV